MSLPDFLTSAPKQTTFDPTATSVYILNELPSSPFAKYFDIANGLFIEESQQ